MEEDEIRGRIRQVVKSIPDDKILLMVDFRQFLKK